MTIKEYNSVKETLERLLPEDSKLRSRILSEFYEAKRKTMGRPGLFNVFGGPRNASA